MIESVHYTGSPRKSAEFGLMNTSPKHSLRLCAQATANRGYILHIEMSFEKKSILHIEMQGFFPIYFSL